MLRLSGCVLFTCTFRSPPLVAFAALRLAPSYSRSRRLLSRRRTPVRQLSSWRGGNVSAHSLRLTPFWHGTGTGSALAPSYWQPTSRWSWRPFARLDSQSGRKEPPFTEVLNTLGVRFDAQGPWATPESGSKIQEAPQAVLKQHARCRTSAHSDRNGRQATIAVGSQPPNTRPALRYQPPNSLPPLFLTQAP